MSSLVSRTIGGLRMFPFNVRLLAEVCAHPRSPFAAKAAVALVIAYSMSPLDLIPDFIPILGHLDDAAIIALGVTGALKMVPAEVLAQCRMHAKDASSAVSAFWHLLLWVAAAVFCLEFFL